MKVKFIKIRYKLIASYLASAILSGLCMVLLAALSIVLGGGIYNLLRWLNKHVIAIPIIFITALLLFFILMSAFFLMLTQKSTRYLEEITQALNNVSEGDLDIDIPIKTSDELGELARVINDMAYKLKKLIEEERSWERAKNELITNISHDLRTPLTSILGYVRIISDEKYKDRDQLMQYIDVIHSKCMSLKQLIDDFFEYSKLGSRELSVNKTMLNLGELLEQVMVGFTPVLTAEGIDLRMSLNRSNTMIFADPVLIARLFENLVNNAIIYGKDGKCVEIEMLSEGTEAVVRVINYGETIPEEELPHIFERLYRVEKSRSRQKGGTGLGLAIVKSIIELHEGKIAVTSDNFKTVFEVRLNVCS